MKDTERSTKIEMTKTLVADQMHVHVFHNGTNEDGAAHNNALRRKCTRQHFGRHVPKLDEDDLEPKPPPKSLEDTPVYFDSFCFACDKYSAKGQTL